MLARDELKLLLVQIRNEPSTRKEELLSFAGFCQIQPQQITVLNVFDQSEFDACVLQGFDAVLVGGSSEASVLEPERFPFVLQIQALLQDCIKLQVPVFASCFGFQLAVLALGGSVYHLEQGFEMGTVNIQLRESAKDDPLFQNLSQSFPAVSVHRDYASDLPEQCQSLAFTESCEHAFKLKDAPFWATQFHPEVDREILIQRLSQFRAHYTDGDDHLQKVLDSAKATPQSNALLKHFVDWLVEQ